MPESQTYVSREERAAGRVAAVRGGRGDPGRGGAVMTAHIISTTIIGVIGALLAWTFIAAVVS